MIKAIGKWLWVKTNKKPPKPFGAYASIVITWVYVGAMLVLAVLLIAALMAGGEIVSGLWRAIGAVSVLCLIALWLGYVAYYNDRKYGYYDAIHKATVEYWHKKRKEYGLE